MLNFIFGRPDLQQAAEHNRRMAQQQACMDRFARYAAETTARQPNVFENCRAYSASQAIDLVEIDGVWQLPPDERICPNGHPEG